MKRGSWNKGKKRSDQHSEAMHQAWKQKSKEKFNSRFSEEIKDEVVELYLTPYNDYKVSKITGISQYCIKKILSERNIPLHSKELKNKLMVEEVKSTKLEKYGNSGYCNVSKRVETLQNKDEQYWIERKEKVVNTCLERYGVKNVRQSNEFKEHSKEVKLEKYGDEYYSNRSKYKKTCLDKYGVLNYAQSEEFGSKIFRFNRYIADNTRFDSFPELCVYLYFKSLNSSVKRNNKQYKYSYKDKSHYCFVDFTIDGKDIEIKGDHLYEKMLIEGSQDNAKLNCLLNNNVEIWTSEKYDFYINWFKETNHNIKDYIV